MVFVFMIISVLNMLLDTILTQSPGAPCDIGAVLPQLLCDMDFNIISTRLMPKLARPGSKEWNWPKTFYYNYFPRLVKMGYLNNNDIIKFFDDFKSLEILPYSRIFCPILIEIIVEK